MYGKLTLEDYLTPTMGIAKATINICNYLTSIRKNWPLGLN